MFENEKFLLDNISVYRLLLDGDRVLKDIMKNIEKIHPYTITPPAKEGGRWQTSIKDEKGNRKNIKASSKELLIQKLMDIYSATMNHDNQTFEMLFEEWLEYKSSVVNSQNTIIRHRQHYKKYFQNSKLHSMKVKSIDEITLEQICNSIVKKHNLARKEWGNAKTILIGMFEYAYRKKYITENPVPNIRISIKFRQVVKKRSSTQTYNTEELRNLNDYLERMYTETLDTAFLCVKLNFLLGLRVGELVALKWTDIEGSYIHIVREEICDKATNTHSVAEHTKTHTDRFVVLIDKAREILKRITPDSEYIFTRDGERITSRQIAYVLEKYAERMGTVTKSTHKMRKTYASLLNANQVPLDAIREMLGHSNLNTTLSYIYNPLTEQETFDLINKAL